MVNVTPLKVADCNVLNPRENISQISLMVETCSNNSSCSTNANSSSPVLNSISDTMQQSSQLSQHEQQQQDNSDSINADSCTLQCIRFSPFQQQGWHTLCDQSLQEL